MACCHRPSTVASIAVYWTLGHTWRTKARASAIPPAVTSVTPTSTCDVNKSASAPWDLLPPDPRRRPLPPHPSAERGGEDITANIPFAENLHLVGEEDTCLASTLESRRRSRVVSATPPLTSATQSRTTKVDATNERCGEEQRGTGLPPSPTSHRRSRSASANGRRPCSASPGDFGLAEPPNRVWERPEPGVPATRRILFPPTQAPSMRRAAAAEYT